MRVEDIMTSIVGWCRPYDTAEKVAQVMWEQDCGAVPVVDQDQKVLGILTDRDIAMAAYTQGRALHDIRVSSAMSRELWTCQSSDEVTVAEDIMRTHRVRRLPVVDANERLVGIISLTDLAREALVEKKAHVRKKVVKFADVGETLGAITT